MINSYWEEQDMNADILEFHESVVEKMGLPDWSDIQCPLCDAHLSRSSIRTIGIKFNTRNCGDIVVEFACNSCDQMDTVYFRGQAKNMAEFAEFVNGERSPEVSPLIEEEMYKSGYNNVCEAMVGFTEE